MKCIHFIIDIRELKIIKVFKNSVYIDTLKSREDALYLFLYRIPIYKGNMCLISETKCITFKSFAAQVLNMFINQSKEFEHNLTCKPSYGIDRNILKN